VATTTALPGSFAARTPQGSSVWDLLVAITLRDLRVKYHGTFLSYFWWIARPLTMGLVLYFALNRVWQLDVENHVAFLLAALFPWFWFSGTLFSATGAFVSNAGLLKKVQFPHIILPLSTVFGGTFEFLVTLPVLMALIVISGVRPDWIWLVGVPALIALQLALLCGLGLLVSALNVYVRDLGPGLNSLLTLLFYVTPIMYPLDMVPDGYREVLMANPIAPLMEAWRDVLVDGRMPGVEIWSTVLFMVVSLVVGMWVLRMTGKTMADAL